MKKIALTILCFLTVFTACDIGGKKMTEVKRMQQERQEKLQNIIQPEGSIAAAEGFSKTLFKTKGVKECGKDTWIEMAFTDRNTCVFTSKKELQINTFFSDITAEYTIKENSMVFDFTKLIMASEDVSWIEIKDSVILMTEKIINKYKAKMSEASSEQINDLKQKIEQGEKDIEYIKQGDADDEWKKTAELCKKRATALKAINPVQAVLSDDKKTLTVSKILLSVEEENGTPKYAENVVFTRE